MKNVLKLSVLALLFAPSVFAMTGSEQAASKYSDEYITGLIEKVKQTNDQAAYDELARIAKEEPYQGPADLGSRLYELEKVRFLKSIGQ